MLQAIPCIVRGVQPKLTSCEPLPRLATAHKLQGALHCISAQKRRRETAHVHSMLGVVSGPKPSRYGTQALGWPLEDTGPEGTPQRRAGGAFTAVRPHALQEHTPLLQGPVEVACPDAELLSMMGLAQRDDVATSLAFTWRVPSP